MAETLGPNNASQVVDLNMNGGNVYTPGYAIYENGTPKKVALFNYVTDPSGNTDYTATISIGGGQQRLYIERDSGGNVGGPDLLFCDDNPPGLGQ